MIFMIVVSKQRTYELGAQKNQRHVDIDSKEERSERFQLMMKEKGIKGKKQRGEYNMIYAHEYEWGVSQLVQDSPCLVLDGFQPRRIGNGY